MEKTVFNKLLKSKQEKDLAMSPKRDIGPKMGNFQVRL